MTAQTIEKKRTDGPDPHNYDPDASIGEILGRVVEDARELVGAEVNLAKAKAHHEVARYKMPAILLVGAFAFVVAALVAFAVGVTMALATLIGPLAGGILATVLLAGVAALLAKMAQKKLERSR